MREEKMTDDRKKVKFETKEEVIFSQDFHQKIMELFGKKLSTTDLSEESSFNCFTFAFAISLINFLQSYGIAPEGKRKYFKDFYELLLDVEQTHVFTNTRMEFNNGKKVAMGKVN